MRPVRVTLGLTIDRHDCGAIDRHSLRKRRHGSVVPTGPVNDRGQCTWRDESERRQALALDEKNRVGIGGA
jgi:hypothetical protein